MPVDLCQIWNELPAFYGGQLRNSLFAGLLTVGTFLFAVKTFIVVKLKEDVFGTEYYKKRLENQRKLNPKKNTARYAPLRHLATVLFYASVVALSSAVLQLTLGLVGKVWSTVISLLAASVSLGLLFWAMILVKTNLNIWLKDLETQAQEDDK